MVMKQKFGAEVGKILKLMIHSIYTNKDIFLRELISNASDACDKARYEGIQKPNLLEEPLKIRVKIDKPNHCLIIEDNGIGMDKDDLIENLGTIASSGTQKFIEALNSNDKNSTQLIGQFGVGFYSAFMISDLVTVYTTKLDSNKTYVWESDGQEDYNISEHNENLSRGTIIKLKIKPSEVEYLEKYRLRHIITTYSDHITFPIELIDEDNKVEQINTGKALWVKSPSEVSTEEYKDFYQYVAHSPDEPWMTLHNKIEGNLEYVSLLYIPSKKPFDLFNPERKTQVKLYIRRVFITDSNISLVPQYLRFLRGIIDSEDLPLNISRETLQHNNTIQKIRKSITKKILSSLKKKANEDAKDYENFWSNFGEVLKEGLCEPALEEKEDLLEVCRFYSTKSGANLVSLEQYIENMVENQNEIYYITGDDLEIMKRNPQLEGFIKRDIEVILLKDTVDHFWVNVINQYKNKELTLVSRSNIDLDKIKKIEDKVESDQEQNKAQLDEQQLTSYIKSVLGEKIKEVKISTKLIDSPACLSISEGSMNINMEKMLIEQKQLAHKSAKILEINPQHPILQKLSRELSSEQKNDSTYLIDLVMIIFNQACLIAGEPLNDPCEFASTISKLLLKTL